MARFLAVQVSALCTILSFVYISHSLGRHSLTERPRLSSLLVLLLSGCICYAASALVGCAPGADGRLTRVPGPDAGAPVPSDSSFELDGFSQGVKAHLPGRPRKWSLPILVIVVVLRLEVLHRVLQQQQCSTPGIESFLCPLLIGHQIFVTRRKWVFPPSPNENDPWRSIFDDLHDWFSGPRVVMFNSVLSALTFSIGTFLSLSQATRSGYLCLHLIDSRILTLTLQCAGLVLDAIMLILLWRLLAWMRSTQQRIQALSGVLLLSALSVSLLYLGNAAVNGFRRVNVSFAPLYGFDVAADSLAVAALLVSLSFWICETSVITPLSTLTLLAGIWSSCDNISHFGDWLHLSQIEALVPLWMIVPGTILFIYVYDLGHIVFIRRILLAILLVALLIAATIYSSVRRPETFGRHPLNDFVYSAHVEHDRWLAIASTSQSLSAAIDIYQERHEGRAPPPNFGEWYQFAEGSAVMDDFPQIDRDLAPFWSVSPSTLRQRADAMAAMTEFAVISVKDGQASSSRDMGNEESNKDVAQLVKMVNKFSRYLPNMVLPLNLGPTPRVLPSWEETSPKSRAATISSMAELLSRRSVDEKGNATEPSPSPIEERLVTDSSTAIQDPTCASDFRQMQVEACPPLSRARTRPYWNFMEFCEACVRTHSQGQLVTKWQQSLQVCSQPDLGLLHGFSLTDRQQRPLRTLSPLFGASKTDEFRDIMIPMPRWRAERADVMWQFARRYDSLVWRGSVGEQGITRQALRGSHKFRLLHLVNAPYPQDEVTMLLSVAGDEQRFGYQRMRASRANEAVPMSIRVGNSADCLGSNCQLVEQAYGKGEEGGGGDDDDDDNNNLSNENASEEPLEYRYVLLVDEDDGPPRQVMRTLRSNSVPLISTIFRTWYTDRLMPWLHFVPVDPRYHGLHSTLAYFTGTRQGPKGEPGMAGNSQDAEWIAQQGKRWAEKALGERDMEIYVFRLLLEWGRLLDDSREEIGLRKDGKGGFRDGGWSSSRN